MNIDFMMLANAGEKLINAAGANPWGATIIVAGLLGGWAIWVWSKK